MVKKPSGFELIEGEEVLWYGRRCWRSFIGHLIILFLILFFSIAFPPLVIVALIWLLIILVKKYRHEYALTNKRIYSRDGIIARNTNETDHENITDTSIKQGIIGRILGYGTVAFNTAGSHEFEMKFGGVKNPNIILKKQKDLSKEKDRSKQNLRIKKEKEKGIKYCRECGAKIEGNPNFCPECGANLKEN